MEFSKGQHVTVPKSEFLEFRGAPNPHGPGIVQAVYASGRLEIKLDSGEILRIMPEQVRAANT